MEGLIITLISQLVAIGEKTYEDVEEKEAQQIADLQTFFANSQAALASLTSENNADKAAFVAAVAAAKLRLGVK